MRLVVGLGNPGEKYEHTRHNIGWLALDAMLGDIKWSEQSRFQALIFERDGIIFVKPQTFMNESGQAVRKLLDYYGLLPRKIGLIREKDTDLTAALTVIHDDLDLPFGDWRLATDSSSAGNRGVQSIIDQLKTKKFTRLRLGIKNELLRAPIPADKFVLDRFSAKEKASLNDLFARLDLIHPENSQKI